MLGFAGGGERWKAGVLLKLEVVYALELPGWRFVGSCRARGWPLGAGGVCRGMILVGQPEYRRRG